MRIRVFSMSGFTLIELLVSLAIVVILTAVLLSRYPETSVRLTLANASHSVSLLVREAQVRGSAIDSVNSSLGGYGVYFDTTTPGQVVLFGDTVDSSIPKPYGIPVGNGLYESGNPFDETKSVTTLPTRYVVSKLCVGNGFPFTCGNDNNPGVTSLTVSFTRPDPTPVIYINNASSTTANAACIELRSPQAPVAGHVRNVQVFSSGMIKTDVGKCDNSPS